MGIGESVLRVILCHMVGDFVLQGDYISRNKGKDWYVLIVHCFLYILPFYAVFGYGGRLWALLVTHAVIDALKARYKRIGFAADQALHYAIAFVLLVCIGAA